MKRIFISQAFSGRTEEYVMKVRNRIIEKLHNFYVGEKLEIIDQYHQDPPPEEFQESETATRLWYLSNSIKMMATCDLVVFVSNNMGAKGCCVEREIVKQYGLDYIFMNTD